MNFCRVLLAATTASACSLAAVGQWKLPDKGPAISAKAIGASGPGPAMLHLTQESPQVLWIRNDLTGQVIKPGVKNLQPGRNPGTQSDPVPVSVYDNFSHTGGISSINLNWNYPGAYTDPSFVVPDGGAPLSFGAINISSDPTDIDAQSPVEGGEKLSLLFEPWTAKTWPGDDRNIPQPMRDYSCVFASLSEQFEIRICRIYFFALADVNLPFDAAVNPYSLDLQLSFAFVSFPYQYIASAVSFDLTGFDPVLTSKGKGVILTQWLQLSAPPPCPGDLNGDSLVDDADFSLFVVQYTILDCADEFMPNYCSADLNGDGIVEDADFSIFVVAYNTLLCPEPTLIRKVYAPLAGGRYQWDSPENTPTYPAPTSLRSNQISKEVQYAGIDYATPRARCSILQPPFGDRGAWVVNRWPFGLVPYEFDSEVTSVQMKAMGDAMDQIEAVCGVVFVPRTSEPNYIHIQGSPGNSSFVGMQGGSQPVNIFNWNYPFIMCHELMHALGTWHEQQRSDRDTYITVNLANIDDAYEYNFDIEASAAPYGDYDFDSVMHYDVCAFSRCCAAGSTCPCSSSCQVMKAKPAYAAFESKMGQITHLSLGDIKGLQFYYGAANQIPATAIPVSPWPMPNSLLTVPTSNDPTLSDTFGSEPSYCFFLTSHTALHQLDDAPLDEGIDISGLKAEYERFVNLAFSTPNAVVRKAYPVTSTLGDGGAITPATQWMPSSTPKLIRIEIPGPVAK